MRGAHLSPRFALCRARKGSAGTVGHHDGIVKEQRAAYHLDGLSYHHLEYLASGTLGPAWRRVSRGAQLASD